MMKEEFEATHLECQEHAGPTQTMPRQLLYDTNIPPPPHIVGESLIVEMEALMRTRKPRNMFSQDNLQRLQFDIADTIQPSHSTGPPANIGTKAQGKLKADQ